jgi:predicted RNA-binding Zn-ribbon protein involved in translation (DUF1610 family)
MNVMIKTTTREKKTTRGKAAIKAEASGQLKCPRCNGAMVNERCQDMLTVFYAWRCLNCGEIVDDVVNRNRGVAEPPAKKRMAS